MIDTERKETEQDPTMKQNDALKKTQARWIWEQSYHVNQRNNLINKHSHSNLHNQASASYSTRQGDNTRPKQQQKVANQSRKQSEKKMM